MKSFLSTQTEPDLPFPKLMRSKFNSSLVVLFFVAGKGTIIHTDPLYKQTLLVGEYREWEMDSFENYNGEVTLRNDF